MLNLRGSVSLVFVLFCFVCYYLRVVFLHELFQFSSLAVRHSRACARVAMIAVSFFVFDCVSRVRSSRAKEIAESSWMMHATIGIVDCLCKLQDYGAALTKVRAQAIVNFARADTHIVQLRTMRVEAMPPRLNVLKGDLCRREGAVS